MSSRPRHAPPAKAKGHGKRAPSAQPQRSAKRKRDAPAAKGSGNGNKSHGKGKWRSGHGQGQKGSDEGEDDETPFEEVRVQDDESWESDEEPSKATSTAPAEPDEFIEFGDQSDDEDKEDDNSDNDNDNADDDGDELEDEEEGDDEMEEDSEDAPSGDDAEPLPLPLGEIEVEAETKGSASRRRALSESNSGLGRSVDAPAARALQLRELSAYDAHAKEEEEKEDVALTAAMGEAAYMRDLFYDSEDSENERELLTIGDVPLEWYEDYDHLGYDLEGKKIAAPQGAKEGEIARFVAQADHPWSVFNERTQKRELISAADMATVQRLRQGIEAERYAPEKWFIQLDKYTDTVHATSQAPEPKRRFLPSKWEARRVRRLAYALKMGWIKLDNAQAAPHPQWSLLWADSNGSASAAPQQWSAPKLKLPGHAESYNPPSEYLFDEEDKAAWEALDEHERAISFVPRKNSSLRTTPSYARFQRERFERCLDLYLAVRSQRTRAHIDPNALLPRLPKPSELRPFPALVAVTYTGHSARVRSVDIDASGRWLASGDDSGAVHVYEVTSGRLCASWVEPSPVSMVAWSPREDILLLAIAATDTLALRHVHDLASVPQRVAAEALFTAMDSALSGSGDSSGAPTADLSDVLSWRVESKAQRAFVALSSRAIGAGAGVTQVAWHHKGDYLASVCPQATLQRAGVLVHQLSRARTQAPFSKLKGHVQAVRFHPSKPILFVATQRHVRVYNLLEQRLARTVHAGVPWVSSLAVHPTGDHVLCGGYDARVCWLDLDMSSPYKILRYHRQAVRAARFHARYPLFATCADDGNVHVFHGGVNSDDLSTSAFIVPLKVLRGHEVTEELGVLDFAFHPHQPWLVSAGADASIKLWVNVG